MTRGCFCLSQPPPIPWGGTELGAVGLQLGRTSCAVMPLEGTVAISLFLGGEAPADLSWGGEAAVSAPPGQGRGGWLASSSRAVPEEPALLFLPALRASPHPTLDVDASRCQQLPSTLLSTSFCGSPFGQVPSG